MTSDGENYIHMANGTKEQKEMAQDALNRFWWPSIMMFGPQGFRFPKNW